MEFADCEGEAFRLRLSNHQLFPNLSRNPLSFLLPLFIHRYFFAVSNYFLYGESLIYYFKHIVFVDAYFIPFARHHRFLSFMLYVFGFVAFVAGLKRANLKHQFGLFCWVHMSLLLIVVSSHFMVNNILEGLIWLWIPASLVVCNDIFAYVCGMLFGRTPLISLSPKKTVEGFVGAFLITEVFSIGWATIFQRFNYMVSPFFLGFFGG